jgi:single-stranded DNA-binding protein
LKVGDKVAIEGVAQLQTWKDDDGNDKSRVVFRVSQFTPIPKQPKAE